MKERTGNFSNIACHDLNGNRLTDLWREKLPPNAGKLWWEFFNSQRVKTK